MFNIRSLFTKNASTPDIGALDTQRGATQLPSGDEFQAQRMLIQELHTFIKSNAALTRERLKTLLQLDHRSHALLQEVCKQYLSTPEPLQSSELTLWEVIYTLNGLLAHAYQAFIKDHIKKNGASETASYQPLITARALRYFRMQIKCQYFRKIAIEPAMWRRLHKLYQLSEIGNFTATPVKYSENSHETTTCQSEYAKILLMDLLNPTTLKPVQIETIESWLKHWAKHITFMPAPITHTHTHCIELSQGIGVTRIANGSTGENYRCWNMAALVSEVFRFKANLIYMLDTKKITTEEDPADLINLLDKVTKLWMRSAPKRNLEEALNLNAEDLEATI